MYVKVRTIDGKEERSFDVSKLISVEDLKLKVGDEFKVEPRLQRLFYRGKQLENGYTIFHYGVGLNDVLQLVVKSDDADLRSEASTSRDSTSSPRCVAESRNSPEAELSEARSAYYAVGDAIDCLDRSFGAWFEAEVVKIFSDRGGASDGLVYRVRWNFVDDDEPFDVSEDMIRPRARKLLSADEIFVGRRVMINYNAEAPSEDGFWFDMTISKIRKTRTATELTGTLYIGREQTTIENCKVNPKGEIYAIEEKRLLRDRNTDEKNLISDKRRRVALTCKFCMDDPDVGCKECGCCVCSGKEEPNNLLLCDECNKAHHLRCLNPPLEAIPNDENWYCPGCKNDETEIVKAGEKLKPSKKKLNTTELKRGQKDWGMGVACLGRMAKCTIVPQNHIGPVPGIEVGMSWEYRLQVSEVGVHRPHVAGIHGRESHCAYSIVLSGGYEDDVDYGDEFMYTGSGGRDLSGNKRTAVQSCDQTLTRMNKALALNCNAKLNTAKGATSKNWREGIPVRVVRSCKLRKRSKYAPEEGNRYDGIYKVVKYFSETGKSGFSVWRYLLRRDDPTAAPWTPEGRKRMESMGLKMIPYNAIPTVPKIPKLSKNCDREIDDSKNNTKTDEKKTTKNKKKVKKDKKKRDGEPEAKKFKRECYKLDDEVAKLIDDDRINCKIWKDCRDALIDGKIVFLQTVAERYTCVCCQEIVHDPVTTPCAHNICRNCIKRSFRAGVHCCPTCRHQMRKNHQMTVNETLSSALKLLFPGYDGGR